MKALSTFQRPRPNNISIGVREDSSNLKVSTAALKPLTTDWTLSLRSSTSATLKKFSHQERDANSATLKAYEFKDQVVALLQRQQETPKNHWHDGEVLEVPSDREDLSDSNKNSSRVNSSSEIKNSLDLEMLESSKDKALQEKIANLTQELESHTKLVADKEDQIRALRNSLNENERRIQSLTEKEAELEGLRRELDDLKALSERTLVQVKEEGDVKIRQTEEKAARLEEKVKELEGEVNRNKELQNQLAASESAREELIRKQNIMQEELDNTKRTLEETRSSLQQSLDKVNRRLEEVQSEIEREREVKQQSITEKTQEIARLQESLRVSLEEKAREAQEKVSLEQERDGLKSSVEQKNNAIRSIFAQNEEIKKTMEEEVQKKVNELNNLKLELEHMKVKQEHQSQESNNDLGEKEQRIINLEAEVRCLIREQEDSRKALQQLDEAKVMINEFNVKIDVSPQGDFMPALQSLLSEFQRTQDGLKVETKRIKEQQENIDQANSRAQGLERDIASLKNEHNEKVSTLEENARRELESSKRSYEERVEELERGKSDLERVLNETRDQVKASNGSLESAKGEFTQTIVSLETEKRGLAEKLKEKEDLLITLKSENQIKDAEIVELKALVEQERTSFQAELARVREEAVNGQKELDSRFQGTLSEAEENKKRLEEKLDEYVKIIENSKKEIAELNSFKEQQFIRIAEHAHLKGENAQLRKKLEESVETYTQAFAEWEEKVAERDRYIEALTFDVNQMKEFIIDHHGEATFEDKEEKEEDREIEEKEENETQDTEIKDVDSQDQETNEVKKETVEEEKVTEEVQEVQKETPVQEETQKKVIVIVEKPAYKHYHDHYAARRSSYNDKYYGGSYNSYNSYNSYRDNRGYDRRGSGRYYKSSYKENSYGEYNKYDNHYEQDSAKYAPLREKKEEVTVVEPVVETKPEATYDKSIHPKDRKNEDPVYKQLEKMIAELNEKVKLNDKKNKEAIEARLREAAREQEAKEQEFLAELEKVKEEKKALLKKIDDLEWNKAYEYTTQNTQNKTLNPLPEESTQKKAQSMSEIEKKKKKKK